MKIKNEVVKVLVDLQKSGVGIYLTEEGMRHFILLVQKEDDLLLEGQVS